MFDVRRHCTPPLSMIFAGGANGSYVRSLSFCHDGRHVATVCDDGYSFLCTFALPLLLAHHVTFLHWLSESKNSEASGHILLNAGCD